MKALTLLLSTIYYLLSTILGCGYTTRSAISDKYTTIYITPFVNKIDITRETDVANKYKITRPFLDTDVTKTVVNKFLFDGNLRPARSGKADLILTGEILEFRREPLRYTDNQEIEEYRVSLITNISLRDRKDDRTVWEEKGFTGFIEYFVTGTDAKPESTAINDAINDLARRIVERTVEQW